MKNSSWIGLALAGVAALLWAQETSGDRVSVKFSDPSRPGKVKANLMQGSITVKGYEGTDVVIEARTRSRRHDAEPAGGLRRVEIGNTGLTVEEENNVMEIRTRNHASAIDLTIQVPRKTSLSLKSMNNGAISVERVDGEMEITNMNGAIELASVGGSAVAHSLNGKVSAVFTSVEPNKPMSFSTMNGAIDVTLPPSVKADLVLSNAMSGDIYTDFDLQMQNGNRPVVEDSPGRKGPYRVSFDRGVKAKINGGGPEIRFKTFNGSIYIRKAK
jgi:DUF4097 and DUF4098 domain-containing protein YvlB